MVIAPIRKKRIDAIWLSLCESSVAMKDEFGAAIANKVQHNTPVIRAVAVLLIFIRCSNAMARYPRIKIRMMRISKVLEFRFEKWARSNEFVKS